MTKRRPVLDWTCLRATPWPEILNLCVNHARADAWEEFVRRRQPLIAASVARIARQRGFHLPVIEDIVQEVYLKLCDRGCRILRDFQNESEDGFCAFLKVLSTNVARDRCDSLLAARRGGGKVVSLQGDESQTPRDTAGSPQLLNQVLLKEIETVLPRICKGSTGGRDEVIFWMYYQQGLTAKEISSLPTMGLTAKGVESVLIRLVHQVRTELARRETSAEGRGVATPFL